MIPIQLTQRTAMNSRSSNDDIERLRTLPKAEVHLHLEGCFEPSVIEKWAKSEGVALPRPRENLLKFSGLADFLGFLDLACGLASTSERLVELSYGLSRRLAESGAG
jgi:adenosine deaminase